VQVEKKEVDGIYCPPASRFSWQGGMSVSPQGLLAAMYRVGTGRQADRLNAASLTPYPGRPEPRWDTLAIAIWDGFGKLLTADAVPAVEFSDGIALDRDLNLTVMAHRAARVGGKPYFLKTTASVVKFLRETDKYPAPPKDAWQYGGVGFAKPPHCSCYHSRFAQDCFGRSFAPEQDIFGVAVLDAAGNLILRVGKYGNVDDGQPLAAEGGPAKPRPVGGDEVALFQANYVGVHSDRRLFIADAGNGRIVSVKLGYHTEERMALKEIPEGGRR